MEGSLWDELLVGPGVHRPPAEQELAGVLGAGCCLLAGLGAAGLPAVLALAGLSVDAAVLVDRLVIAVPAVGESWPGAENEHGNNSM